MANAFVLDDHIFGWALTPETPGAAHPQALRLLKELYDRCHGLALCPGLLERYRKQSGRPGFQPGQRNEALSLLNVNFLLNDLKRDLCDDSELPSIPGTWRIPSEKRLLVRLALHFNASIISDYPALKTALQRTSPRIDFYSVLQALRFLRN